MILTNKKSVNAGPSFGTGEGVASREESFGVFRQDGH